MKNNESKNTAEALKEQLKSMKITDENRKEYLKLFCKLKGRVKSKEKLLEYKEKYIKSMWEHRHEIIKLLTNDFSQLLDTVLAIYDQPTLSEKWRRKIIDQKRSGIQDESLNLDWLSFREAYTRYNIKNDIRSDLQNYIELDILLRFDVDKEKLKKVLWKSLTDDFFDIDEMINDPSLLDDDQEDE